MRDALAAAKLFVVDEPLDPVLGVTRFISDWIGAHGFYPTFVFSNLAGNSDMSLVMNLLKREIVLGSLGLADADRPLATLARRLAAPGELRRAKSLAEQPLSGLDALPILQHQPRDAGRYLTSFIGSLRSPDDGSCNLGFYRALVTADGNLAIFMDPRTDAHRIVAAGRAAGETVPITLFNGGPLSLYLAAAAKLPGDFDSFDAAARMSARPILVDDTDFPPAPAEAEIVIRGYIAERRHAEAPFGEFKGYYCAPTSSPLVEIASVTARPDAQYLGLFCGKESGLTLMALQNELLMYTHLRDADFAVDDIRFPLAAFGEYAALIATPEPSAELVTAAMAFDPRCKLVAVARTTDAIASEMAIFPTSAQRAPYLRYGRREGDQVGLVCSPTGSYDWTEL